MLTDSKKTIDQTDPDAEKLAYFHGYIPREDINFLLPNAGDFLLRKSETQQGSWTYVLSARFVDKNTDEGSRVRHYVVRKENETYQLRNGKRFKSIGNMISWHLNKKEPIDDVLKEAIIKRGVKPESWELTHDKITLVRKLGSGQFGDVCEGIYEVNGVKQKVAVKMLKIQVRDKEKIKEVMNEARLMREVEHPNVARIYGVACDAEPIYVVMELIDGGSLDVYLRQGKTNMEKRLRLIRDAAAGLAYLHRKGIMHRDIAARNALYDQSKQLVKIADFGLAVKGASCKSQGEKLPIKWLAPEVLSTSFFTSKSDVYSFGVMCWEILNNGALPFNNITTGQVQTLVMKGKTSECLTIPADAPPYIKTLLKACWEADPKVRWDMEKVEKFLDSYMKPPSHHQRRRVSTSNKSVQKVGSSSQEPPKQRRRKSRSKGRSVSLSSAVPPTTPRKQ